jgi:formylglycine-generating enzyme required for sulfatase activity
MRLRFAGLVIFSASSFVLASFSACSSTDPHPDAGNIDVSSSSGSSSGRTVTPDAAADTGADAAACFNNAKDGTETDVDCGGQCKPCEVDKLCAKKEDCEPGLDCEVAEVGKQEKKCRVGTCTDTAANGKETDVNCGGATGCERCTLGKRCAADTDCRSGKCTAQSCACPPNMAIVALAGGVAYCIDQAEVTKGDYDKFITANIPTNTQSPACLTNTTFQPADAFPTQATPPASNGLAYNKGLPVHYVDWCDAVAYCKFAQKELCGKIGGGPVPQNQASTASTAAWYTACSGDGSRQWAYGVDHIGGQKCNEQGGADGTTELFGYTQNKDDGLWVVTNSDGTGNILGYTHQSCLGGFGNLYQMTGNAAEWENSCSDDTTPGATCNVRGGSYNAAADEADGGLEAGALTRCDSVRQLPRTQAFKDVGFRCCLY